MRVLTAAAGTCQFRNGPVRVGPLRPSACSLTVVASAMLACSTPDHVGNGLDSGVSDGGVPNPGEALGSSCARAIVLADTRLIATTDEGVVAVPKAGEHDDHSAASRHAHRTHTRRHQRLRRNAVAADLRLFDHRR